jgi:hypothetical protein
LMEMARCGAKSQIILGITGGKPAHSSWSLRNHDGILCAPPKPCHTLSCYWAGYQAESGRQLRNGASDAAHGESFSDASIVGLHRRCCPSAVGWLVMPLVVNAVDAVLARWTSAHVGKKVGKLVPSGTDVNPSPAVVRIVSRASRAHGRPDAIFRCVNTPVARYAARATVLQFSRRRRLGVEASTACRLAISNVLCSDHSLGSAIAQEQPIGGGVTDVIRTFCLADSHKPSEPLSRNLGRSNHMSPLYHED